ncbi:bifunctional ADP-heptose synthase [Paraflavisolibacter sp. H34]|uniref:bifunctional heptose 7-phosphate kinase/heptose 1-phosphate adenyltransferase n=1 Tax=Huijunlia imazamoxiresistens TaxID=3127457 RepID=UPI0030179B3D
MDFSQLFQKISGLKVGVIGDVMLDTYMWGQVDRISPEAPVPIVSLQKKEQRIGGAGNVALNVQSLQAKAFVLTVTGKDEDAVQLNRLFAENHINTAYSFASPGRITTNKTRIISRNQHMMRLDAEITTDLDRMEEERILELFEQFVARERPDIVILEDYNKGVLTEGVIRSVISICRKEGILTAVDPKRKNFFEFRHVDVFKPNLKEAKEALNIISGDVSKALLENIHLELHHILQHQISFITLSEKGVFYQNDHEAAVIPSHLRNIADVSGAGDTVIAVASLVYAATRDVRLMAEISNIAGGLVCEEVGTVAIDGSKLLRECALLLKKELVN